MDRVAIGSPDGTFDSSCRSLGSTLPLVGGKRGYPALILTKSPLEQANLHSSGEECITQGRRCCSIRRVIGWGSPFLHSKLGVPVSHSHRESPRRIGPGDAVFQNPRTLGRGTDCCGSMRWPCDDSGCDSGIETLTPCLNTCVPRCLLYHLVVRSFGDKNFVIAVCVVGLLPQSRYAPMSALSYPIGSLLNLRSDIGRR